jgi:predicted nuclease with RNAse H fold
MRSRERPRRRLAPRDVALPPAAPTPERFIGIDVGARAYQAVALSPDARLVAVAQLETVTALGDWLASNAPDGGTVAVDAPLRTSEGLMADPEFRATLHPPPPAGRYLTYRVCDYELARRGLPLYLVPYRYPDCPGWMRAGFSVYDLLLATGRWSLFEGGTAANRVAEVYPFAAYVALLGHVPPAKQTPAGRAERLVALSCRISGASDLLSLSHHELDAAAAALTARALWAGDADWVGHPREALIVVPSPLKERYRRGQPSG